MRKVLEIVSMIKVGDEWVNQDDLPSEQAKEIITKALDRAMENIGYQRMNSA